MNTKGPITYREMDRNLIDPIFPIFGVLETAFVTLLLLGFIYGCYKAVKPEFSGWQKRLLQCLFGVPYVLCAVLAAFARPANSKYVFALEQFIQSAISLALVWSVLCLSAIGGFKLGRFLTRKVPKGAWYFAGAGLMLLCWHWDYAIETG
jgi:hypothetical protein